MVTLGSLQAQAPAPLGRTSVSSILEAEYANETPRICSAAGHGHDWLAVCRAIQSSVAAKGPPRRASQHDRAQSRFIEPHGVANPLPHPQILYPHVNLT